MDRARVAIIGGSGYGGGELLRLLSRHPGVEVHAATSRRHAGRPVHTVHENLLGILDLKFTDESPSELASRVDLLFFALPHGQAAERMASVLDAAPDIRVVDLSGDFRLESASAWEEAYGRAHPCPALVPEFVYGLTEAARERIAGSRRIANPGCFATGAILALLPLAEAGRLLGNLALSGITGSSGSGADPKPGTHHPERAEDFRAYRPLTHQHVPEIAMALRNAGAERVEPAMVPMSAPLVRGIFTVATLFPTDPVLPERLQAVYSERYGKETFVRLRPETPRVTVVRGTNFADVAVTASPDGRRVVALSAIDNLVKGMTGQAVQNMNLILGQPETTGLLEPGSHP